MKFETNDLGKYCRPKKGTINFSVKFSRSVSVGCCIANIKIFSSIYVRTWAFSYVFLYSSSSLNLVFFPSYSIFYTEKGDRANMIILNIHLDEKGAAYIWKKKKKKNKKRKIKNEKKRLEICTLFGVKFIMIIFCVEIWEYYCNIGARTKRANDLYCACM